MGPLTQEIHKRCTYGTFLAWVGAGVLLTVLTQSSYMTSYATPAVTSYSTPTSTKLDQIQSSRSMFVLNVTKAAVTTTTQTNPTLNAISPHNDVLSPCENDCVTLRDTMSKWNASKPRAAIYYLAKSNTCDKLLDSLQRLYRFFNNEFKYPVIIFHESEFASCFKQVKNTGYPLLFFEEIAFQTPSFLRKKVPEIVCGKNTGYRHMCRFHARMVYFRSIIRLFDYILRLDDDSYFTDHITYDFFQFMVKNDCLYGYVKVARDSCAGGLWEAVEIYVHTKGIHTQFFNRWRKGTIYYNNFELSKTSIWLSNDYMSYVDYIDNLGGIYYKRWGDAPIKTIGVSLSVLENRTHHFHDIPYRHQRFSQHIKTDTMCAFQKIAFYGLNTLVL